MITINVIKVNAVEYLTGKEKKVTSRILKDLRDVLLDAAKKYSNSTTVVKLTRSLQTL
jgi:hypothetical protein